MKLKKVIRKFVNESLFLKELEIRKSNDKRVIEMFESLVVESDSELRNLAIDKIKNNEYEEQDANKFKQALSLSKHSEMFTDYSISELNSMKLFKVDGLNIGFALKKHGDSGRYSEIVSVFNNEPEIKGIGEELLKSAIKNGGCYLDHFDTSPLEVLYSSLGFEEYHRDKFDAQYDPEHTFRKKYGEADIVYRKLKNCS